MRTSSLIRAVGPVWLVLAFGVAHSAPPAAMAAKPELVKPVVLKVQDNAAAKVRETKAAPPPALDNSERELWRHHGVG